MRVCAERVGTLVGVSESREGQRLERMVLSVALKEWMQ